MIIQNFQPFIGQHCETTATGSLLKQIGINLSEPMLFGLGEGLGFIFWNMKSMAFPFIGGRTKPDLLTANLCNNLNLKLDVNETASKNKAWDHIAHSIDNGNAVGLKLDCYHLEYFTNKFHFPAHYVAMYGYDDDKAFLVDTEQQGTLGETSLTNLALARSEKGPMASKNLSYTIERNGQSSDLAEATKTAIVNNAASFLNPPIGNFGYKGIIKTSEEIVKWFNRSNNVKEEFTLTAVLMERGGTGGALFRNLYRDFLKESFEMLQLDEIDEAHVLFASAATKWNTVSSLLQQAGESENIEFIHQASMELLEIASREKTAMEILSKI